MFFDGTYPSKYLIYLTECYSATNNILAKQKRRLHQRTIADSQKGKCKRDPGPMLGTASLHHIFESEIFGFYLWATYFDVNSLQFSKLLPSSNNHKLSLVVINKESVLDQIFLMQHSITRIASSRDVLLLGLKLR